MRRRCIAFFVGVMVFIFGNVVIQTMAPVVYGISLTHTIIYLVIAYAIMTLISALMVYILAGPEEEGGGRHR